MTIQVSQNSDWHAVMFHHFHNKKHPAVQGSISADVFSDMLDWLQDRYSVISADEYLHKSNRGSLRSQEICLTFDDALLCQAEVAAPILNSRGLNAFFFVYSSPFSGMPDYLEVYRFFRTTKFVNIDAFYSEFFSATRLLMESAYEAARATFGSMNYLAHFAFYTANDRWFRYLRDEVLDSARYAHIMSLLMKHHCFDPVAESKQLWMAEADLVRLKAAGHIVGLHSFSHPTTMHKLSADEQESEYLRNFDHLTDVLSSRPKAMSHPSGNYNLETLGILSRLAIQIGFRADLAFEEARSKLEVPRQDHANVLVEMSK